MQPRPTLADRLGAGCGAAYILLILVGNQLGGGGNQDPHPSGTADLAAFAGHPTLVEGAGWRMEIAGFIAFMFFLGWMRRRVQQLGGAAAWLSDVAAVAGVVTLAVKLGSAAPVLAGRMDHGELTPVLARVLYDLNAAAFVITFLPYGAFLLALGLAILASGFLGRVAGWSGVVLGALTMLAPLASGVDPVGTNVLPFLLGLFWLLAVSVRLAWKGPRQRAEAAVTVPVPAAA
jgi:hypothetical protein